MKQVTVKIFKKGEEPSERSYWLSVSPEKRFEALEELRQSFYGKNYAATARFQRVCTIVKREKR